MDDFKLFTDLRNQRVTPNISNDECTHENISIRKGYSICKSCGMEVAHIQLKQSINDSGRCYIRKTTERSIHPDLQDIEISEHIKDKANDIFNQVCSRIRRANFRKGVVFGCVFFAYKASGEPQSCDSMIKKFNISKKRAQEGLKFVNENLPHGSPLLSIHITEEDIMREFMKKLNSNKEQIKEVIALYRTIKGKSPNLARRKPQSIAAGMIYHYIQMTNRQIPIKEFMNKVNLSELTIIQTAKECSKILNSLD